MLLTWFAIKSLYSATKQSIYSSFDKNKIFEDTDFYYSPFSPKNKYLSEDIDSINRICKKYDVNPKFIYTLLEYYNRYNTNRKTALYVGCYNDNCEHKYFGFDKQVKYACIFYRSWFEYYHKNKPKNIHCVDGNVIPQNGFTYALYTFHPFIGTSNSYNTINICDETGRLIKVKSTILQKTPHSVYKIWLIWKKL